MAKTRQQLLRRFGSSTLALSELLMVVRELSFDELKAEALQPPQLLLIGANAALLHSLREALAGSTAAHFIEIASYDNVPANTDHYDAIVLVDAAPAERARPAIQHLLTAVETSGRTLTFQLPANLVLGNPPIPPTALVDDLRNRLVAHLPHRQLALGRYLPPFRQPVATSLINQASRANAEFALLSSLPTLIPLVGNLFAVGADFLILTKNQLMLIYKLAAIHDRELDPPWRLYAEMAPVVGAGLVWRTVARELANLLPFAAGTIPKVAIAFAGTAVVGQTAHFFYEEGRRPSRAQLQRFYRAALDRVSNLPLPRSRSDVTLIEGTFRIDDPSPTNGPAADPTSRPAPSPTSEPAQAHHDR